MGYPPAVERPLHLRTRTHARQEKYSDPAKGKFQLATDERPTTLAKAQRQAEMEFVEAHPFHVGPRLLNFNEPVEIPVEFQGAC